MTMKDLLRKTAEALSIHPTGNMSVYQDQICTELKQNSHILIYDECEYLFHGNTNKLDTIRQIYDDAITSPIILSGTYKLKSHIVGKSKEQPQIFRRMLKAEFSTVTPDEFNTYLDLLEQEYNVIFQDDARNTLYTLCLDTENGSLGVMFLVLNLIFVTVRPEWHIISRQLEILKANPDYNLNQDFDDYIDVSTLKTIIITNDDVLDALKFKTTK